MGIISVEKADHLFWLGRYTERVFTTLRKFFHVYDHMIDTQEIERLYGEYCERLSIPNIYTADTFVQKYLFDEENPDSMRANMERAYDNAVVLRDELTSNALAYIQLSLDVLKSAEGKGAPIFKLQPVIDYLFAFWGCMDDYVENEECRNIIKAGKYMERLDLYLRLEYHTKDIEKEFCKLEKRLVKSGLPVNTKKLNRLKAIIAKQEEWSSCYFEALSCLGGILEVM